MEHLRILYSRTYLGLLCDELADLEKGKLSPEELVRLRVRYFTDGVVLGSKAFVEGIFAAQRERFSPKRKEGSRRIAESEEPFYTLRKLRLKPLG
jgi:REP-associated tyrosine transposase